MDIAESIEQIRKNTDLIPEILKKVTALALCMDALASNVCVMVEVLQEILQHQHAPDAQAIDALLNAKTMLSQLDALVQQLSDACELIEEGQA